MLERIKNIILNPGQEWQAIAAETKSIVEIYTGYVLILAAIGPVASIIGTALVGINVPMVGFYRVPIGSAITQAIISYILTLVGVYILAFIIDLLAPTFSGEKNITQAFKVSAYSATASFLGGIFSIWPDFGTLGLLVSLYSVYLLYLGLPLLMKCPQDKSLVYTIAVIVIAIIIFVIIGALTSVIVPYPLPIRPGY